MFFERAEAENGVTYTYKMSPPLKLEILVPELYAQHEKSVEVFDAYWQLLSEMASAVSLK